MNCPDCGCTKTKEDCDGAFCPKCGWNNVVNSAFTMIRAAQQMKRPPVKTTYHTDDGPITTHDFPGIVKGPYCKWYRNPIWWWKMRHLRADIELLESEVDPAISRRMQELEEQAFLVGAGN